MKLKLFSFYSRLLSACLVLLGFGACITSCKTEYGVPFPDPDPPIIAPEYGVPYATYRIKGKVVSSNAVNNPIEDIRVVAVRDEADNPYLRGDTVYTDSKGEFEVKKEDFPFDKYKVKFQDIDGEENGLFEDKEQFIEFKDSDYKGGDGWNRGEAQKDMGNVELKPKKQDD